MQTVDSLLDDLTGKEFFKGGFDRLIPMAAPFKEWIRQNDLKIITIGGTNGKGETVYYLEQFFKVTPLNVVSFSSPHIQSVNERIKFNQKEISDETFIDLLEDSYFEIEIFQLSYYELIFLCFLKFAKSKKKVDILLLEVGLGGPLDAVNLLDTDYAAITSISRDHQEILGKNLKDILNEKLGIIRNDKFLVTCLEQSSLRSVVKNKIKNLNIDYFDLFASDVVKKEDHYKTRNYQVAKAIFNQLSMCTIPTLEEISPSKGRGELMTLGIRSFIFIGAHNVDGIRKMTQYLSTVDSKTCETKVFDIIVISFSKRTEKEIEQCLEIILQSPCLCKEVIVTAFSHYKAATKIEIEDLVKNLITRNSNYRKRIRFVENFDKLLTEENENNKILVTGSYYFIGEFQQYLKSSSKGVVSI